MDTSRRAVESYWRSRMIDGATADEDKVTPVYKLEEICELLRSSHFSIVKEVSEFVLKRLEHKSPVVKQKALRLIKYCIGKSGVEFRREIQRNSAAIRELSHYRGQPDPLKGDALNKAVRDTAHEAISVIFAEQDNKPLVSGEVNRRIEGFGNTNFIPSEDKKSFLSEVVELGTASIKQGLTSFAQANSFKKNETGTYRSPNIRRSFTTENDYTDKYTPARIPNEVHGSLGISKDAVVGPWNSGGRTELTDGRGSSTSNVESKTREVRLLETIVTTGGVRLQPTRDAIHAFLAEAAKCDGLALSQALESKLQFPQWQVRVKAVCVLESILRKKNEEPFSTVASYFSGNMDILRACSESPQASLREKTNKVLSLLAGEQGASIQGGTLRKVTDVETPAAVQMPDLIDTGIAEDILGADDSSKKGSENLGDVTTQSTVYDLLGDTFGSNLTTEEGKTDDDPFADVSFHSGEGKEDDIFSGLAVDNKHISSGNHIAGDSGPMPFDIFASNAGISQAHGDHKKDINDMVTGLSIEENALSMKQKGTSPTGDMFSDLMSHSTHQASNEMLNNTANSQISGMSANAMSPAGSLPMPYALPPSVAYAPAFPLHPSNYEAMASLLAQQQFLATMASLQNYGNMNGQNAGINLDNGTIGGQSSPLPDIFQANFPIQTPTSMVNNRKEETKAFDFISDHVAAARDSKRVG